MNTKPASTNRIRPPTFIPGPHVLSPDPYCWSMSVHVKCNLFRRLNSTRPSSNIAPQQNRTHTLLSTYDFKIKITYELYVGTTYMTSDDDVYVCLFPQCSSIQRSTACCLQCLPVKFAVMFQAESSSICNNQKRSEMDTLEVVAFFLRQTSGVKQ